MPSSTADVTVQAQLEEMNVIHGALICCCVPGSPVCALQTVQAGQVTQTQQDTHLETEVMLPLDKRWLGNLNAVKTQGGE